MRISASQWLAILGLDVILRAAGFVVINMNPRAIAFSLPLSFINVLLLIAAYYLIGLIAMPSRAKNALTLVVANAVFFGAYLFVSIAPMKRGHITACALGAAGRKCAWIVGDITWYGVRQLAISSLILLAMNLIPFLAVRKACTMHPSRPS